MTKLKQKLDYLDQKNYTIECFYPNDMGNFYINDFNYKELGNPEKIDHINIQDTKENNALKDIYTIEDFIRGINILYAIETTL
jgi:hypothetical protein